ncbi:ABC-type multidrug transport system ATPase subunit [Streptomyces demainii]|uniref:ABC-type multidrug transport system ATPase subunit n=1 Tax=Streptomyces demainii TaxID=588122 RepID=A0ABT9L0B3_9ACTN|nr:ABC-type multidrug transport system ATPase subunit [Streptomyces demainii]
MRLRGVGRRYGLGGPWVLQGVDLDVPPGSLTRVEGTNGSGKSTLLRLLAGIDAPSAGRITGRPRTAYVPERFPAELPFSALGYLTHLGRIHGLSRRAAVRGAGEWLERFGADGYAGTPLAELSKGTSQKIAVAQALLAAPGLLVLDEAWTGLDQAARGVLDAAVAERVADGGAVVFVDHDPRRLAGAQDRVLRVTGTRLVPVDRETHNAPRAAGSPVRVAPPPGGCAHAPAASHPAAPAGEPRWRPMAPGDAWVQVEAEGPPGAEVPVELPGLAVPEPGPASVPGSVSGGCASAFSGPASASGGPVSGPGGDASVSGGCALASGGRVSTPGLAPEPGDCAPASGGPASTSGPVPGPVPGPGGPVGRVVRLTVGAAHSDAVLRSLLTADPPWHIRRVTTIGGAEGIGGIRGVGRLEPQEPTEGPEAMA